MRASNTAELVFDDCVVPASNVVGGPGESMIHMMRNLELERIGLAAVGLGIARRCLAAMNQYAGEREAFGRKIRDFGQIQRHIGESWAEYRAMRAYVYDTARATDLSMSGNRLDSDGVKLFGTTAAKNIADRGNTSHGWLWLRRRVRSREDVERCQTSRNRRRNLGEPSEEYHSRPIG